MKITIIFTGAKQTQKESNLGHHCKLSTLDFSPVPEFMDLLIKKTRIQAKDQKSIKQRTLS